MSKLSEKLISLRENIGLSQADVAEKMGVTEEIVACWEGGSIEPERNELKKLAEIYNVDVHELLSCTKAHASGRVKIDLPFVHIDINGEETKSKGEKVHMSFDENGKKMSESLWMRFPYPVLATVAFLVMGFVWGLWNPGWLVFVSIPVYYWFASCMAKRKVTTIPVAAAITIIYLVIGFTTGQWHPWWILFVAIPIFDFFAKAILKK